MRFDKKIFRNHYGQLYFCFMFYGSAFALLFLQIIFYGQLFSWNIPQGIKNITITLMSVILIIVIPVAGFMYFDCQREAQNQQQWIDRNKVFYRVEKRKWWSLRRNETHTLTYEVQNIKEAKMSHRFFEIIGSIQVTDETDTEVNHHQLDYIKIPRCFTNEEKIMKVMRV